jgi:hypothetical protein
MKNLLLSMLMILALTGFANDKYEKNMTKNIELLYSASNIEELQTVANAFQRIATIEKEEWLPNYYCSLAYLWMATSSEDMTQRDKWLDQSQVILDRATSLESDNSEIVVQGFILMIKVTVDSATRGATFAPRSFAEFSKSVQLNPENPRALFFKGQMEFGTAQFFKSDTAPGCATMTKSLELFDNFTPESAIYPNWGADFAKKNC